MGEDGQPWRPVYRKALPVLLERLLDELDVRVSEAAEWSQRNPSDWFRYVQGEHVPGAPAVLAEGLGISVLDLERAWIVACAELLGLGYVDLGRDRRSGSEVDERFVYWRVFFPLLRELHERNHWSQAECARRAGLSGGAWNEYFHGRRVPVRNLSKVARGLGMDVDTLEVLLVLRSLEEVGLAADARILEPGPCWVMGGVLLDDGRLLVAETLGAKLWEYDPDGQGRRVDSAAAGLSAVRPVARSPDGAVWLYGDETFVQIGVDLRPIRSYGIWGRRDDENRLLETLIQWTLVDDETVVGVATTDEGLVVARLRLESGTAGRFETLEVLGRPSRMQQQYWAEGSPKLAAAQGQVYMATVSDDATEVRQVGTGEVVASYPGGAEVMEATCRAVGECFVGLSVLGLVAVEDEILVWHRRDGHYWLEDLHGELRCRPRGSHALRLVPVVGRRLLGLLELVGESVSGRTGGLMWLESWRGNENGGVS